MARTRLLSRFQQLFQDFDEAERSGQSVAAVQEKRQRLRLTRRDFLKTTGAAAGALALGGPLGKMVRPSPKIAIVGGGIAGLNAALTLQDAGIGSTVYEASSRVGGRMHSDTTSWANGQVSEHCGELIDTGHKTIQQLAKRFGFGLTDLLSAQPNQSTDTFYFLGGYYPNAHATSDFN